MDNIQKLTDSWPVSTESFLVSVSSHLSSYDLLPFSLCQVPIKQLNHVKYRKEKTITFLIEEDLWLIIED